MSWNANCVFIKWDANHIFSNRLAHDEVSARQILRRLNFNGVSSKLSTLNEGINPPHKWICVGAYEIGCILAGFSEMSGWINSNNNHFIEQCLLLYPESDVLVFELAGGTNHFAFALYKDKKLVRKLAGDAERGVYVDEGMHQAEEELFYEKSLIEFGETLVFALAARFLGTPLDQYELETLRVELFEKHKIVWPFTLFRRE